MYSVMFRHPVFGTSELTFVLHDPSPVRYGINVWRMELFDNDMVSRLTMFYECGTDLDFATVVGLGLLRFDLRECF